MSDLISRAAAIDLLKQMRKDGDMIPWEGKDVFARIRKLPPAQPSATDTNVGSNLIDRGAALDALDRLEYTPGEWATSGLTMCKDAIMALPSAQTERKKGKWIERNPRNSPDCRLIECSECGNAYIVGYNINYDDWIDGRNFCMKCGADLRGGSNGKST